MKIATEFLKEFQLSKEPNSIYFKIVNLTSSGAGLSEKSNRGLSAIKLSRVWADNEMKVNI